MSVAALPQHSEAFPADLVRFSTHVEYVRAQKLHAHRPDPLQLPTEREYFGAQLMPLNDRDLEAMQNLFAGEEMDLIDADVGGVLRMLWPEPCWEEEIFGGEYTSEYDFLAEFL